MNSGLKRLAASRGRMIHRSKNLERHVVVLPSGAEIFMGLRPSTGKVGGRKDGRTFNAGIQALKRANRQHNYGLVNGFDIREIKAEVWADARAHS